MRVLLFVAFVGLILSIQANAQSCATGASLACMNYVLSDVGYSKAKAAEVCSRQ